MYITHVNRCLIQTIFNHKNAQKPNTTEKYEHKRTGCQRAPCRSHHQAGVCRILFLTFVANLRLLIDSLKCSSLGETLMNISVLELPPSEFCSK